VPEDPYVFPMSFAQQRLWFLDQIAPNNPFYNIPLQIEIRAAVDPGVLAAAINEIVRRHEALRTAFRVTEGRPVQVVSPVATVPLPQVDISRYPASELEERTRSLATDEARRPFDLGLPPLVRTTLVHRGPADHVLLLTIHHIVADGWSVGIFARELATLYQAFSAGRPSPLPDLAIQYPDFAVWQREWLQGERLQDLLGFWTTKLADAPSLAMPTDRPRPAVLTYRGAFHPISFPPALSASLRELSRQQDVTLFMTLMAAFIGLLNRYTDQDDIVVGTPIANRNRDEIEELIGFFVNSLALRCDVTGNPTFRELLARLRRECLDAYAHQDLPFEKLVEHLNAERDPSRNPLFQVTLQVVNTPTLSGSTAMSGTRTFEVQRGSAIFDIAVTILDVPGSLRGMIEYSTDLFDSQTIARLDAHFRAFLHAVVLDPDIHVKDVSFITRRERAALLAHADTAPDPPSVMDFFAAAVDGNPERIAVSAHDGALTYGQLDRLSGRLAAHLEDLGAGPSSVVGLFAERSTRLAVAVVGALKAGAAYVPLDPDHPTGRLAYILRDAGPCCVLTDRELADQLPADGPRVLMLDEAMSSNARECPRVPRAGHPAATAYVIYTSGSTGAPKGVMIPRAALDNHMLWMAQAYPLSPTDRVLQRTPYSFDASVWEFLAPIISGAELVMLDPAEHRDPQRIAAAVVRHEITILQTVPALLELLLEEPDFCGATSLRRVFCGGDVLPAGLRDRFAATVDAELCNLYGPTEATIDATSYRCARPDGRPIVPIGRPITNCETYVLSDRREPVPIGVPGDLYIGGIGLATGYVGRPRLTAERFLPDPYGRRPGARLYGAGDRVRLMTDGNLEFLGRRDQQVKIRGYRVELGEIETALSSCPGVARGAVALHHQDGRGDPVLVAYVVPERRPEAVSTIQSEAEAEQVARWAATYERIYDDLASEQDVELNLVGWNSSYDGAPIREAEMTEWRAHTVERILALQHSSVLEIGCGTGLVLYQVAPRCHAYVGTDFSRRSLEYLRSKMVESGDRMSHVELLHRSADDFSGLDGRKFDLVVLNSVIQYFPSEHYLRAVLAGALRCLAPGGAIFLGDVRNLQHLEPFHTTVELSGATPDVPASELLRRVENRMSQERELLVHPAFFSSLAEERPDIAAVDVQLKRSRFENELSRFRYDVVLHTHRGAPKVETAHTPNLALDWERDRLDVGEVRRRLGSATQDVIVIAGVPDRRLIPALRLTSAMHEARPSTSVRELRAFMGQARDDGVDPEELWDAAGTPFEVTIHPAESPRDGCFDAVFSRRVDDRPPNPGSFTYRASPRDPGRALVNNPVDGDVTARVVPEIRHRLEDRLPEYMLPSRFILLDDLPLLPNGKLDRQSLPSPVRARPHLESTYVAPRGPLEEALAGLWADVLGLDHVGVRDDFFTQLGGHSLLATQLIARVRETFRCDVPLQSVFQYPTVEKFAENVTSDPDERARLEATAILVGQLATLSEEELDRRLRGEYPEQREGVHDG
jgi:amino acid adenylation domain-containing protein